MTLQKTLKSQEKCLNRATFYMHHLNMNNIEQAIDFFHDRNLPPTKGLIVAKYLSGDFSQRSHKILTSVREPVALNISSFFQNINYLVPDYKKKSIAQLIDIFFEKFPHDRVLNWFDQEIKSIMEIDIFHDQIFDLERGYSIYKSSKACICIIRLESFDQALKPALENFLGLENCPVLNDNESQNKDYYHVYKQFKKSINIPQNYLDRMYSSNYTRKFYSKREISQFYEKWAAKSYGSEIL